MAATFLFGIISIGLFVGIVAYRPGKSMFDN